MALDQILAGNIIYADDIQDELDALATLSVTKVADEILSNNSSLQNDDELFLSVEAGVTYTFSAMIFYGAGTTPDIKFAWTFPTGTLNYGVVGLDTSLVYQQTVFLSDVSGSSRTYGGAGVASFRFCLFNGKYVCGTAGTFRLQWAQNTPTVENTVVKAGSFLSLRRSS